MLITIRGGIAADRHRDRADGPKLLRGATVLRRSDRGRAGGGRRPGRRPALPFVSRVSFRRRLPGLREELRRALPFFAGSVYSAAEVEEGAAALERRLVAEGFPRATVIPETEFDAPVRRRGDYRIESGERARVGPAIFPGARALHGRASALARRLKPGEQYRESKATRRRDTDSGVPARPGAPQGVGRADRGAARPTAAGSPRSTGRRWARDRASTPASRPKRRPAGDPRPARGPGLRRGSGAPVRRERAAGFSARGTTGQRSTTRSTRSPTGSTCTIDGRTDNNSVERIMFEGTPRSGQDPAQAAGGLAEGLPLLRSGELTDQDLKGDVDAVLGYYQANGWIGAKVGPAKVSEETSPGRLVLTDPDREGPRTLVGSRTIVGAGTRTRWRSRGSSAVASAGRSTNALLRQDAQRSRATIRTGGGSRCRCARSTSSRPTATRRTSHTVSRRDCGPSSERRSCGATP